MMAQFPPSLRFFSVMGLGLLLLGAPAHAQSERELANRLTRLEQSLQRMQGQAPAAGPDASVGGSDLILRLSALERMVQQLTGQIEETRFTSERTARQVQTMQDDLSLRLATIEQSLGVTPSAAPSPQTQQQGLVVPPPAQMQPTTPPPRAAAPAALVQAEGAAPPAPASAFLPGAPMSAPVMAQPTTMPSTPAPSPATAGAVPAAPEGDVNASGGFVIRTDAQGRALAPDPNAPQVPPPAAPLPTAQQAAPRAAPGPGPVTSSQVAAAGAPVNVSIPDGTPKQQYEFAFEFMKRQDFPRAEVTLRDFLQKHPKDPLAGNAQYWLGETYYVRGDYQQAAVEFMAGYQKYPKTNKGPDNLLKLGMSMGKLNQTEGACTALGRLGKDYPDAPAEVKKMATAERSRLKCK